jgi:hypothetical protein
MLSIGLSIVAGIWGITGAVFAFAGDYQNGIIFAIGTAFFIGGASNAKRY